MSEANAKKMLLANIQAGYMRFEALLAPLSEAQMNLPEKPRHGWFTHPGSDDD